MGLQKAYWFWDIQQGTVEGGEFIFELLNLDSERQKITWNEVKTRFKEEEKKTLREAFDAYVESKGETPFKCETEHKDEVTDQVVPLLWFGEVISWSDDGKPLKMSGLVKKKVDLGSKKKLSKIEELLFFRLMDNLNESIFFKDLDSRFIKVNKECARKFGLDHPKEAIGKTDFDIFGIEHAQEALEDEQRIIATEEPIFQKVEKETFVDDPEKFYGHQPQNFRFMMMKES